jgi:hypothetical protein
MYRVLAFCLLAAGCNRDSSLPGPNDLALSADLGVAADLSVAPDLAPTEKPFVPEITSIGTVTSDGWAIVQKSDLDTYAVHLTDGTITSALPFSHDTPIMMRSSYTIPSPTVLFFDMLHPALHAWTSATGDTLISTTADGDGWDGLFDASPDGKYIAYLDHFDRAKGTGDVTVDHPDHSAPRVLASVGVIPYLAFRGGRLIVWRQPGNDGPGTVTSYDPETGDGIELAPTTLGGRGTSLFSDTYVLASPADGQAELLPVAGGPPIPLVDASFYYGGFVDNNQAVLFMDKIQGLHRVALDGTAPYLLQPLVNGVIASPDASFVLFNTTYSKADNTYDLFVTSGTSAGAAATKLSGAVPALFEGFTSDSRYALYLENAVFSAGFYSVKGDLKAAPTDGGAVKLLANNTAQFESVGESRVVAADHCDDTQCDLELIDVAAGTVVRIDSGVTLHWTATFLQVPNLNELLYLRAEGLFLWTIP